VESFSSLGHLVAVWLGGFSELTSASFHGTIGRNIVICDCCYIVVHLAV
jgi:hypothetical protein